MFSFSKIQRNHSAAPSQSISTCFMSLGQNSKCVVPMDYKQDETRYTHTHENKYLITYSNHDNLALHLSCESRCIAQNYVTHIILLTFAASQLTFIAIKCWPVRTTIIIIIIIQSIYVRLLVGRPLGESLASCEILYFLLYQRWYIERRDPLHIHLLWWWYTLDGRIGSGGGGAALLCTSSSRIVVQYWR